MLTLLEVVVSPKTLRLLVWLRSGVPESHLPKLPLRQRQLIGRLWNARLLQLETVTGTIRFVRFVPNARYAVPERDGPLEYQVTREDLDGLGLADAPPFRIAAAADRRKGRPHTPGPRVFLRRLPTDYTPSMDVNETALALIALDPRVARAFISAQGRPHSYWDGLRRRIREEGLEGRARYRGIHALIGMRRTEKIRPSRPTKAVRSDAFHRAKTEPKLRRGAAR